MSDIPKRAPKGASLAGDDYQHLATLNEVLRAIRGDGVTVITVEARGAGSVDDIVVHYEVEPPRHTQAKHAVDATSPVGSDWLTKPTSSSGKSLLKRLHASWVLLGGAEGRPYLRLLTDRERDPGDPILKCVDTKTGLVVPDAGANRLREARAAWAGHLEVDDNELMAFLSDLRFVTGRTFEMERERAALQLEVLGYNCDQSALDSGIAMVRDWAQEREGERTLRVEDLIANVETRIGRQKPRGALLVVEGLADDPAAGDAEAHFRMVELYADDTKRQLIDPADWTNTVLPALSEAATQLRKAGHQRVVVRGPMRLPVAFGAGYTLRHVLGFRVDAAQGDELWSSDQLGSPVDLDVDVRSVGDGSDLAVAIGVAYDPSDDVAAYVRDHPTIGRLVILKPASGASNQAIPDARTGSATAEALRNAVRSAIRSDTEQLHLFLATPQALAVLLGHGWNALRPTTAYEHLGTGRGYARTFTVPE